MLVHLDAHYNIVIFLKSGISNACQIDSQRIHVCDRGWELVIKIDEPTTVDIERLAKMALSLCTDILKYHDAKFEVFGQYDQKSGEIRIPYKDLEPEKFYEACVKDNSSYTVLDTVTT